MRQKKKINYCFIQADILYHDLQQFAPNGTTVIHSCSLIRPPWLEMWAPQSGWRRRTPPSATCHAPSRFERLSRAVGSMVRRRQWPFSRLFFCPLLRVWKHVQLPHHSVSAAVSRSPRLKTPKGPPGKVAHPISQDLCQKCFSPQVICYSLGPFHYYFKEPRKGRENEREMKGRKNDI